MTIRGMPIDELRASIAGSVFTSGDNGYREALAGFNTATTHTPDVVVVAHNAEDVARAVGFARDAALSISASEPVRVTAFATGHGDVVATSGVVIATSKLNHVSVNPISRVAVISAGARWSDVIEAAAQYNLTPIAGSAPNIGAIGFLLGGGLGPFARSHGFSSDYVTRFRIVTGNGEIVIANNEENAELFWALRGGKSGFGIVTEATVRLVSLKKLYAGSLSFAESDMERVLRAWVRWTHTAHPMVTTSVAITHMPDIEAVPAPIRGHRIISVRFAFPGEREFGAELAAPLRAFAPALLDDIAEMPAHDMGRIHNDPTRPMPTWVTGLLLDHADDDMVSALLTHFGAGSSSPFRVVEVRHIGQATSSDVTDGSAVAGRSASYTVGAVAGDPTLFHNVLPGLAAELAASLEPWRARERNPNLTGLPASHEEFMRFWPRELRERLERVRSVYDATGMFAPQFSAV